MMKPDSVVPKERNKRKWAQMEIQEIAFKLSFAKTSFITTVHDLNPLITYISVSKRHLQSYLLHHSSGETVESNEVAPQPPFLQTIQAQSPQLLLRGHAFQPFQQLCCPPLDAFKYLHIPLKLWGPELHTVLQAKQPRFPQPLLIRLVL
ncbi:hypothetical protein QYF61_022141 [Mycteria americana]|uniref:Uncharacterized protein n=1 Tax=Mycteria americana TaxID=33587 RepID=A0AAN7MQW2_MYCAM|nr:hypothetical protein QYF61_022141 [Mycteria americana]